MESLLMLFAIVVLGIIAWIVVMYYLKTEKEKLIVKIGLKNKEIITPVRLQAYERIVLLLERIEPSQLIMRNVSIGQTASQLQQLLITNIREEFDHNLSQQLYISSEAWNMIKKGRESAIAEINEIASKLSADALATDLAQLIFQNELKPEQTDIQKALEFVKNEARLLF